MAQVPGSPFPPGAAQEVPAVSRSLSTCLFHCLPGKASTLSTLPRAPMLYHQQIENPSTESENIYLISWHFTAAEVEKGSLQGMQRQLWFKAGSTARSCAWHYPCSSAKLSCQHCSPPSWMELWPLLGTPASCRPPLPLGSGFCEGLEASSQVARERLAESFKMLRSWNSKLNTY